MINTPVDDSLGPLTVSLLGPLDVTVAGQALSVGGGPVGGGRLRALLVRLAISPNQRVSGTALVDDLWAGDPPADPANALQTLISRLRRVLGDPGLVRQESGGYRLVLPAISPGYVKVRGDSPAGSR